jgi:hypothetical protein
MPLLFILTITCFYFAIPTIKTVTTSTPITHTVKKYVTKNIEDIQEGDEVFAYDVQTGKVTKRKVTETFERSSNHLRYLTVRNQNETQVFETTDSHPFWVVTNTPDLSRAARDVVVENGAVLNHENLAITKNGFYVEAKDLKVGDTFIGANGEPSTLEATERNEYPDGVSVYNFTVEDNHNYFVIANFEAFQNGSTPVLVHNASYNIQQGVHRSAAARDIGMEKIKANVNSPDGKILATDTYIPVKELYSPLDTLKREKYLTNLEQMIKNPSTMPAIEVMPVNKSRFKSIMDVH